VQDTGAREGVGHHVYCTGALHTQTDRHRDIHRDIQTDTETNRQTDSHRDNIGKTNLDFTEARDSEWQWHQLGYMQVRTLLQADNHASTAPLSFLQAGCPSCHTTNSVKALKAKQTDRETNKYR